MSDAEQRDSGPTVLGTALFVFGLVLMVAGAASAVHVNHVSGGDFSRAWAAWLVGGALLAAGAAVFNMID